MVDERLWDFVNTLHQKQNIAQRIEVYSNLIRCYMIDEENTFSKDLNNITVLSDLMEVVCQDSLTDDKTLLTHVLNVSAWVWSCTWLDSTVEPDTSAVYQTLSKLGSTMHMVVDSLNCSEEPLWKLAVFLVETQSVRSIVLPHLQSVVSAISNRLLINNPDLWLSDDVAATADCATCLSCFRALHNVFSQDQSHSQRTQTLELVTNVSCSVEFVEYLFRCLLKVYIGPDGCARCAVPESHHLVSEVCVTLLLSAQPSQLRPLVPAAYRNISAICAAVW